MTSRARTGFTIVETIIAIGLVAVIAAASILAVQASRSSHKAPSPAVSPTPKPLVTVAKATDESKGATFKLKVGDVLTVSLDSTYWTIKSAANPTILSMVGEPIRTASGKCVAGGGCGTASVQFKALSTGTTAITASRVSCGEALACGVEAGSWQIAVEVSR